jgi:hypothetical protein
MHNGVLLILLRTREHHFMARSERSREHHFIARIPINNIYMYYCAAAARLRSHVVIVAVEDNGFNRFG